MRIARTRTYISIALVAGLIAAASCSADMTDSESAKPSLPPSGASGTAGSGGQTGGNTAGGPGTAGNGGEQPPPPEKEVENLFESPVATGNFVWVANPQSGRVAFVNAKTFEIQTVLAGAVPKYLARVSKSEGSDQAIVINVVSHDASLLTASPSGQATSVTFPISDKANSWAVSNDGHWAIAWGNYKVVKGTVDPLEGFQDITVIDLSGEKPKPTRLSVGYRPVRVTIASDNSKAYVVTFDGISVIELGTTPHAIGVVSLDKDVEQFGTPELEDVSITPDGSYAIVRHAYQAPPPADDAGTGDASPDAPPQDAATDSNADAAPQDAATDALADAGADGSSDDAASVDGGSDAQSQLDAAADTTTTGNDDASAKINPARIVSLVSLSDGKATHLVLPGNCTDIDLSPDGTMAIAALRSTGQVAVIPLPQAIEHPDAVEVLTTDKATIGSVSMAAAAPVAFFYSNAVQENRLTYLQLATVPHELHTTKMYAPVLSVFPSSNGTVAIAVHQDTMSFSVQSIAPLLPGKIVAAKAPITSVALTREGDRALVAENNENTKVFGAYLVRSENLQVDRYELSSPPISAGMVEGARRGFVAQDHPEGRITFIDLDTGLARTLTGFELGAQVIDGSHP